MVQGRIKRLQSVSRAQETQVKAEEPLLCPLCDRPIPFAVRDAHHLIPKSRGGIITVLMHRACHRQIHALFTETDLARHYASAEALRAHPEMVKFIHWIKEKPNHFNPRIKRSRSKV